MMRLFVLLSFVSLTALAVARDYWRVVGDDVYRQMSQFERRQYDKAMRLMNDRQYKAAATEFERFTIQYTDSDAMPYMIFLRANALHSAGVRNQAIGIYDEVHDFYPDETAAAAPALYYKGRAQLDNGETARGVATLKAFLEDPKAAEHPVSILARMDLATSEMRAKNYTRATELLKDAVRQATALDHDDTRRDVLTKLVALSVCHEGALQKVCTWYASDESGATKEKDPAARRRGFLDFATDVLWHQWWLFRDASDVAVYCPDPRRCPSRERQVWDAMGVHSKDWQGDEQRYDFAWRRSRLALRAGKAISSADFDAAAREAIECAAKRKPVDNDKDRAQRSLAFLFDLYADGHRPAAATLANARIADPQARTWNQGRLLELEENWKGAVEYLASAEKEAKSAEARTRLAHRRAEICRDRLHDYDQAIRAYRDYSNPPTTLWRIAECQRAKKDLEGALKTLREIEAAFPDQGGEAAFRRAEYQDQIGDGKLAVKEARGVLKRYPGSSASSRAHQLLERYGIDTGGAERD